jgi:hypothetical protein
MDAKYEVGEEIRKLRANIKYSEKAVRVVQRIKRKMEDKQKYWEEKELLRRRHEQEWQSRRAEEMEHEVDVASQDMERNSECPETQVKAFPCSGGY